MPNEDDIAITRSSISNTTSYEEIGEFWDNHGLDEYWEETYPVEFKVNLHSTVTYYGIDETLSEQIRTLAQRRGISPTKLLTLWVQEKLHEEMA
ncbi:CopG family antitoxin [Limnofasciculus baicalensis]|uniref:BrnA antitoxin family protein n=1 Tax=Limnofasciculus baicalensis BBK-W-15 TaxID=2699891 RepID=A0AAE3GQ70_9CYAN|nr:CopG family antitoxin [Limnofasciculus baicalensis]MCP2728022.1 BrnA antitoxin family protein [Limnofasciculus baicalensis BBK-W-15]